MEQFQARRRMRRIIYSWPMVVILAILVALCARASYSAYGKYKFSNEKRGEAEAELASLSMRADKLKRDVSILSSERGKEALLRSKFDVAKPGEDMIVLIDEPAGSR